MTCPKCGAENLSWLSRCQACGVVLHPDEEPIGRFNRRPTWIGYVLSAPPTVLLSFFLFTFMGGSSIEGILVCLTLPLVGLSLGWKWPLAAGILMITEGCLLFALIILAQTTVSAFSLWGTLLVSAFAVIPFLMSGVAFIAVRR